MSVERPRIGVVGTGWWATQAHLPALIELRRSRGDGARRRRPTPARRRPPSGSTCPMPSTIRQQLFTSGVVDGVLIAVPHVHHYPLAKAALEAGLHVMLEKPMVLEAAHAWDLVETAESAGLHLMVGYTYQFTRAAAQRRRARRIRPHRRAAPRLGTVRLDGRVVLPWPTRGLRGRLQVPGDRTRRLDLRRPGDRRRRSGPDAGHPRDGNGAVGDRPAGHRGVSVHGQPRPRRRPRRRNRLPPRQRGRRHDGRRPGACARASRRSRSSATTAATGYVLQDLLAGTVVAHFNDGSSEEIEPLGRGRDLPGRGDEPGVRRSDRRTRRQPGTGGSGAHVVEFLEAAYRSAANGGEPVRIADRSVATVTAAAWLAAV